MKASKPTPVGHQRKDPQTKAKYKCPFCGYWLWPKQISRPPYPLEMMAFQSQGYKNMVYLKVDATPETKLTVRKAFIKRCFDVLKLFGVTKAEVLSEFELDDLVRDREVLRSYSLETTRIPAIETMRRPMIEVTRHPAVERY